MVNTVINFAPPANARRMTLIQYCEWKGKPVRTIANPIVLNNAPGIEFLDI